ncbi:macrophage mannose receptor 1 [Notolabrus celidotus]|uniref:macrophage mannose receptor 1 n=1 Tax=Notolabrus celidotus TaxID=1203425 RepID=UPI0014904BFC|nr:macrophage mannose receptor 1 [Notolabrus celidotus]
MDTLEEPETDPTTTISIVMKRTCTLQLILISGFCTFALGSSEFHLIKITKSYNEAKTYCREMYTDLASVHNLTDMNNLITSVSFNTSRAWIGLESQGVRRWHWSRPYQKLDFFNWRAGEPQNTDQDACAVMDPLGKWFESECGTKRSFVCQGNVDTGGHIFVAEAKSWRDAESHCRDLSSELVSINSEVKNEAVRDISVSQNVWIGLFKDPWRWSDGSTSSFRFWKPSQPNYLEGQDCVVGVFRNDGRWNDLKCGGKRDFVCRGARKVLPATTIQPSTQLSQTTNEMPTNITTFPNTSEEFTITYHFNVTSLNQSNAPNVTTEGAATTVTALTPNTTDIMQSMSSTTLNNEATEMSTVTAKQLPSNQSNAPNVTTEEAATTVEALTPNTTGIMQSMSSTTLNNAATEMSTVTAKQLPSNQSNAPNVTTEEAATTVTALTPNTTELMQSMSSTTLNNEVTEMSTVTAKQLPSNTTEQATTSGASATTTPMMTTAKTSTQMISTTQPLTPKPTEDSQSRPPGNLILIKKNLTWIDAMTYCRMHHVDLVHITSKHIQEKVAEKAKNSTSPHVWLGLRYTCHLNFWFWTNSRNGCYQNWAPGQGSDGKYDCDTTGAIEATGGQQWVGLSQTQKLNFICSTCPG